jgi:hypothetical protein
LEDIFGQIERPYYSVLKDQFVKDLFAEAKIKVGDPLFCLSSVMKDLSQDRINELKRMKGCDASNKFDEEPLGQHESEDVYYSDDELEGGHHKKPKQEFIGKRNRDMDEEEWTKNKKNKDRVQELKQKHSNQPPQRHLGSNQDQRYAENLSFPINHGQIAPLPIPEASQQVPYGHVYSSYMTPIIPQMTQEQLLSYNHYLAQINMMYGLPPYAQNNYLQPQNPGQGFPAQDAAPQTQPDFFSQQHQNPQ